MGKPDAASGHVVDLHRSPARLGFGDRSRGRDEGGRESLEGQRGQQAHAVELGPSQQRHPGGRCRRVDFGPEGRALGRQHDLVTAQLVEGNPVVGGEGMAVGHDEDPFLVEQRS